jgi:hypothetical protein
MAKKKIAAPVELKGRVDIEITVNFKDLKKGETHKHVAGPLASILINRGVAKLIK